MKSPYRDDKKAKAMATLSVYNIKAKKGDEHRNETVTYIDMTSVLLNSSVIFTKLITRITKLQLPVRIPTSSSRLLTRLPPYHSTNTTAP